MRMKKLMAYFGVMLILLIVFVCGMQYGKNSFLSKKVVMACQGIVNVNDKNCQYRYRLENRKGTYILTIIFESEDKDMDYCVFEKRYEEIMPRTIKDVVQVVDVNSDGVKDLIFDIGIWGKVRKALCFVYDERTRNYVELEGFEELCSPVFDARYNVFFENYQKDMGIYTSNKYCVEGKSIKLVGSLLEEALNEYKDEYPVYSEYKVIDGENRLLSRRRSFTDNDMYLNLYKWNNCIE